MQSTGITLIGVRCFIAGRKIRPKLRNLDFTGMLPAVLRNSECSCTWALNFEYLNENINDVNAKFNRFLDNLNDIVKKHAPLKKLTKKELKLRNKPWINGRIQKMMRLRDKALKKLRKKPDEATKFLHKQFRNRITIELKVKRIIFIITLMLIATI